MNTFKKLTVILEEVKINTKMKVLILLILAQFSLCFALVSLQQKHVLPKL